MKKETVYIHSNDGMYKKQCKDYNEAIKLQNDARSIYHLGLIVWGRGV